MDFGSDKVKKSIKYIYGCLNYIAGTRGDAYSVASGFDPSLQSRNMLEGPA